MIVADIFRMSISKRQSKMSAASERRLRSDVRSVWIYIYIYSLICQNSVTSTPSTTTLPSYSLPEARTEGRLRHAKQKRRTTKEDIKRGKREREKRK